jgi:hypothetical protein
MHIFSHIQHYHIWHTTSSHLIETKNASFSQWIWRLLSYRSWNCVVCYIRSAVSEKLGAIIVWESRNCVQWMNNQRIPGPSRFLNQNVCNFHFWKNLMMTVYRHHSRITGNSQCQSRKRGGTFSVCHKLQYVTDKGDWLMESMTFSRYCNIMINDVGRTPFSSSGSPCELQHSLSIWWPTTQQKILKHNGTRVQCNSLHDLLQYAGHAYTPKVKCLISDFIELKMYMLKHACDNLGVWNTAVKIRIGNQTHKLDKATWTPKYIIFSVKV